ncbi:MAG: hypothetical protein LC637_14385 [Xanthomonadaceae bacterium]|nr:hypothetical protein [Xanthomonadaceae bacterium]
MLEEFTADTFENLIGQSFHLRHEDWPDTAAKLVQVRQLSDQNGSSGRAPFSLLFACDGHTEPVQAIFRLEHEKIGGLDLFLVPVGQDERGLLLEAIFT